ncbi:MAG: hypothetical protein DRN88_04335 [Candidatus Hydrothermarchaeota archaeon]|nr:MAG: hypothetical protein DRN88_04335 [Candidatus Hydrothermarchaeota archaeon]
MNLREVYIIWKKEMLVWAKNPLFATVRSLGFPLLWILIFGFAFGGTIDDVPVALVQEDYSSIAQEYVAMLQKEQVVSIISVASLSEAMEMIKAGKVYAVIFIPPDFNVKKEVQVTMDETSPQVSSAVLTYLTKISSSQRIHFEKNTIFGRGIDYIDFLAPGVIMMTIVFSSLFTGGLGLIVDRDFGTLKMLLLAPIDKSSIIMGKTVAGVTQSLISGIASLIIAIIIGVKIKTGIIGIVLMLLLMIIAAFGFIGMSIAIGTKIYKIEQLMLAMIMLVIPMWFLCGGIYPIESMPWWMQPIAKANPLTYATHAARVVMIRSIVWESIALDLAVMLSFAIAMLILGTKAFKRTID